MKKKSQLTYVKYKSTWINDPNSDTTEYGVYHFRKSFQLASLPDSFVIKITADNRYRLFVNGVPINSGPARGDIEHWYYETINIKSFLNLGTNLLAVLVWNMGEFKSLAQISLRTGLFIEGETKKEMIINTNESWKVIKSSAYTPCSINNTKRLLAYMVVGPGDRVFGPKYNWGWETLGYDDHNWAQAKSINVKSETKASITHWNLTARNIPLMYETILRIKFVRRTHGIKINNNFFENKHDLIIQPHKNVTILMDQGYLTVGYPEIILSSGKSSSIQITYAEALFDSAGNKGNRNEIVDKEISGNYDIFYQDGGNARLFRTLWIRTFRYVQLDIITHDDALVINDFYSVKTGYPLELKASFTTEDDALKNIWEIGWRTTQLSAGETYYDSPYYEQLQYIGDTRIQAMISIYLTGDDRLVKKALLDFFYSKASEILTQSRYPSNKSQIIPAFSLFWISMIHDFWMYNEDHDFIFQFIPAISDILNWFFKHIACTGMLGPLPFWNFVEWDSFDLRGNAPGAVEGGSSIITLQLAFTVKQAAELMDYYGLDQKAIEYNKIASSLSENTWRLCYNKQHGLIADTPSLLTYSKHAGIWAILSDTVRGISLGHFSRNLLHNESTGQISHFYQFYLNLALKKANLSNYYFQKQLEPWKRMISLGLTTFAETVEETRSDCHGWSASPLYHFLSTTCGIISIESGFRRIIIKPALANLNMVEATMPHPKGMIILKINKLNKGGFKATIVIPHGVSGEFLWSKYRYKLSGGLNCLSNNKINKK